MSCWASSLGITRDDWPAPGGKGKEQTNCRQWLIERACRTDADCGGQSADGNVGERTDPLAGRVCDHRYDFTTKCSEDMTAPEIAVTQDFSVPGGSTLESTPPPKRRKRRQRPS